MRTKFFLVLWDSLIIPFLEKNGIIQASHNTVKQAILKLLCTDNGVN